MATKPEAKRVTRARPRTAAKKPSRPKKRGPAPFRPTKEQREQVAALAGYGLPVGKLVRLVTNPATGNSIDEKTLRKHFAKDMEDGRAKAWAQSLQTGYNGAHGIREVRQVNPDGTISIIREEAKPDKTLLIWYQKTQMGIMEEEVRVRTRIAERIAEMRGIVDEGADPHDIAKRIKEELNKLEESVAGAPRSAAK